MGQRTRSFSGACAAACVVAGTLAAAAAAGAPSIAAAPLISVGQQQVTAVAGIDYWRVRLRQGDRLTLQYGPQKETDG